MKDFRIDDLKIGFMDLETTEMVSSWCLIQQTERELAKDWGL